MSRALTTRNRRRNRKEQEALGLSNTLTHTAWTRKHGNVVDKQKKKSTKKMMIKFLVHLHFLILLSVCFHPQQNDATGGGFTDDLLRFKARIEIDVHNKGRLESWQNTSRYSACQTWRGVDCDSQGNILALDLSSSFLSVNFTSLDQQSTQLPLPPGLKALSLSDNNLTGSIHQLVQQFIPASEDGCSLETVDLSRNALTGDILPILERCRTLRELNLSSNRLTGDGSQVWNFSGTLLQSLDVSHNSVSASLVIDGSVLKQVNLSHNSFTGPFPRLALPNSLQHLSLSNNQFTELKVACHSLVSLDVSYNNLTDPIILAPSNSTTSSSSCPSLKALNIARNSFPSQRMFQISTVADSLERLDASSNGFTGDIADAGIPQSLRFLDLSSNSLVLGEQSICSEHSALSYLVLSTNQLSGPILASLLTCSNLSVLDLSFNLGLSGPIPTDLCHRLPNLQQLIIWKSSLTGQIPRGLSACSRLNALVLSFNSLRGPIPEELSRLENLTWLALSSNQLTGAIPSSLGLLKKLTFLELSNNSLTGTFPPEISSGCERLLWLDLSTNQLTGGVPGRLGPRKGSKIFPTELLLSGHIAFAMNSNSSSQDCLRGIGALLPQNVAAHLQSCKNLRLYPISSYNLSSKPLSSPVLIDLSYNQFTGSIPDEVGEMVDLALMDFGHNNLTGSIPPSFGHLKSLLLLDLSSNSLSGSLPDSLSDLTFLSSLNVSNNLLSGAIPQRGQLTTFSADSYGGNTELCGVPTSKKCEAAHPATGEGSQRRGSSTVGWPTHFVVAALVSGMFILGLAGVWIWWRKLLHHGRLTSTRGGSPHHQLDSKSFLAEQVELVRRLTYLEVDEATQSFKVIIGSGGSGQVYRGRLRDGTHVAVKRLFPCSLSGMQSDREFMAEMETLGKIDHVNLVKLVAYCKWKEERILIYELMQSGNLEQLLSTRGVWISWQMRKRIAMDAARGLCFLHHSCVPHIIHRDVKSSNILLDANFEAKVSDFGMARLMRCSSETHLSVTTLSGTPGYVPPEYYQSFRCTRNGDVYSYGVILLELLTRKRPTEKDEFGENGNLVGWVKAHLRQGKAMQVLDPELRDTAARARNLTEVEEMMQYLRAAAACVEDEPHKRPSMLQLVARFKELSLQVQAEQQHVNMI